MGDKNAVWKSQSSKERAARMTEDSGACVKSYHGDHFRNYRHMGWQLCE